MKKVKIVSSGVGTGTQVLDEDGNPFLMRNITAINILPIVPNSIVHCEVTIGLVGLDIDAHAFLSLESLKEMVDHYGYALAPKPDPEQELDNGEASEER